MTIIQQCINCNKIGKNSYCNNCIKSIDYFNVIRYNNNRFDEGEVIGKIKAYTWHDAIEFIKNNFYRDKNNLDINCEKEFAYIEQKTHFISINTENKREDLVSYKICLNKEGINGLNLSTLGEKNMWDATSINNN